MGVSVTLLIRRKCDGKPEHTESASDLSRSQLHNHLVHGIEEPELLSNTLHINPCMFTARVEIQEVAAADNLGVNFGLEAVDRLDRSRHGGYIYLCGAIVYIADRTHLFGLDIQTAVVGGLERREAGGKS